MMRLPSRKRARAGSASVVGSEASLLFDDRLHDVESCRVLAPIAMAEVDIGPGDDRVTAEGTSEVLGQGEQVGRDRVDEVQQRERQACGLARDRD